ncbi:MAG: alpha/beta hydrolase [Planctomycetes bacterium]|nr:alpha/beta hydrolase [Planctomycetota bacterium]
MLKSKVLAIVAAVALFTSQAVADPVVLVVKSATILPTKANGAAWDFPLVGTKALPDPYVKAWVYDSTGAQADYGETGIRWDTLGPIWNEDIVKAKAGQKIKIEVWDKDLKYDDLIGARSVTLTQGLIDKGSFILQFGQVKFLRLAVRTDGTSRSEPRVTLMQPFPGPHSANELTRSKDQSRAIILLPGLDLRDDGASAATPRFVDWQGSTSTLVKCLSHHADVFSIAYAQTAPVEEIASYHELRESIEKVKKLGYREIVLLGHSAGGLIARHFVEENPGAGVTRVIQVATPNGGAKLAGLAVNFLQVPKDQAKFVESLSPSHRDVVLKSRQNKSIPTSVDFVTVVACPSHKNGDGAVHRDRQWTSELKSQGVPCVCLDGTHMQVINDTECVGTYCKLATEPQPRWSASKVQLFASAAK